MFQAALVGGQYSVVMVETEEYMREVVQTKRITYNRARQTIVQYGTPYIVWNGNFAFDNEAQLAFLRSLALARKFLFTDGTQGGRAGALVFWPGDFVPIYDSDELTSGRVKFRLEFMGVL